jgi:hypothetical protein
MTEQSTPPTRRETNLSWRLKAWASTSGNNQLAALLEEAAEAIELEAAAAVQRRAASADPLAQAIERAERSGSTCQHCGQAIYQRPLYVEGERRGVVWDLEHKSQADTLQCWGDPERPFYSPRDHEPEPEQRQNLPSQADQAAERREQQHKAALHRGQS